MDDLLYTVFIIAWIAYGIYKGVRKSNTPPKKTIPLSDESNDQEKRNKVSSTFESIFNEVFDLPESGNDKISHPYGEEQAQKEPKTQPVYENYLGNDVLDSYKGSDSVTSVFEHNSYEDIDEEESDKIFDNQVEEETSDEKNTVFDLRQAIIHQVILERPY
jgi:hypothetical protein